MNRKSSERPEKSTRRCGSGFVLRLRSSSPLLFDILVSSTPRRDNSLHSHAVCLCLHFGFTSSAFFLSSSSFVYFFLTFRLHLNEENNENDFGKAFRSRSGISFWFSFLHIFFSLASQPVQTQAKCITTAENFFSPLLVRLFFLRDLNLIPSQSKKIVS